MEKLLFSLGPTASPSSQWADGWTIYRIKREAGKVPCAEWSLALPPCGWGLLSQCPQPLLSFGSLPPSHPWNVGYWERQSHSRQPWWQESLRSRRWRSMASSVLSGQPRLGMGQRGCSWGWGPTHILHPETLALRFITFMPLFASELAPVLKKAMIQDEEAEPTGCVIQKKGYGQWDFRNKFNFGFPTFSNHKN